LARALKPKIPVAYKQKKKGKQSMERIKKEGRSSQSNHSSKKQQPAPALPRRKTNNEDIFKTPLALIGFPQIKPQPQ